MKLKKMTFKGLLFSGVSSFIIRTLSFATTIVLSRILSPYDFGLMGQALLFINILTIFCDLGFSSALVYQKEDLKKVVNTAFIVIVPISFFLSLLGFIFAPKIALFFGEEALIKVCRILCWTIFLSSFSCILNSILVKKMQFEKLIYPEVFSVVIYIGVTISLALKGFGVWSLVWGYFSQVTVNLILLYFYSQWKFEFIFDKTLAYKMFSYGKEIILTSFILYLAIQGDNLFCGKFLKASALGFYALAYNISNLPAIAISQAIGKVAFPLYSKLQDQKEKLKEAFLKMFLLNCILSLPFAIGIFVLAKDLIFVVLGEKWLPMLNVMKVLCFFGFLRSMGGVIGPLFNSVGKPYILRNMVLIHVAGMALIIFPLGFKFGILGVGISVLIAQIISVGMALVISQRVINFNWLQLLEILSICFTSSAFMAIGMHVATRYLFIKMNLINLAGLIVIGTIIYFIFIFIFKKRWYFESFEILKQVK